MKPLRILLVAFAAVVVAGTIATAAPGFHVPPKGQPELTASPTPEPSETESPDPEPTETESPDPEPTETASAEVTSQDAGTPPDFSACAELTGLANAICRHEALLQVPPDNPGLANSLSHLQANEAAKAARASSHGASGQHGHASQHGNAGGS